MQSVAYLRKQNIVTALWEGRAAVGLGGIKMMR